MSDTPQCDREKWNAADWQDPEKYVVDYSFAQSLERLLARANKRTEELLETLDESIKRAKQL